MLSFLDVAIHCIAVTDADAATPWPCFGPRCGLIFIAKHTHTHQKVDQWLDLAVCCTRRPITEKHSELKAETDEQSVQLNRRNRVAGSSNERSWMNQCSRMRKIRILFFEKYVRICTYFSFSYVKNTLTTSASVAVLINTCTATVILNNETKHNCVFVSLF